MPRHAFPSHVPLLLQWYYYYYYYYLLFLGLCLHTSCPSLLGPSPKILLQRESRELLKSERSKLWLSSTSKVWSTRPIVKPEEEKQPKGLYLETRCVRTLHPSHAIFLPNVIPVLGHAPAVASWHLSKDQRTSTACPRSLICCSISRNFARTCDSNKAGFKAVSGLAKGHGRG